MSIYGVIYGMKHKKQLNLRKIILLQKRNSMNYAIRISLIKNLQMNIMNQNGDFQKAEEIIMKKIYNVH
jgi:mevalonate pyrophosphate decarboxylase